MKEEEEGEGCKLEMELLGRRLEAEGKLSRRLKLMRFRNLFDNILKIDLSR